MNCKKLLHWPAQSQSRCVCRVCVCLCLRLFWVPLMWLNNATWKSGYVEKHTPPKPQRPRGLHSRFVVQARIQKKQNDFLLTHNWLAPRALRARGARMRRFAPQSGASRRLVLINFWLNSRPFERNATLQTCNITYNTYATCNITDSNN